MSDTSPAGEPDLFAAQPPPRPLRRDPPEEFYRRLDAALERTGGNRSHAIIVLGLDKEMTQEAATYKVRDAIRRTPWLAAKWTKEEKKPLEPSESVDIDRPPMVMAPDKLKLAEAIAKQDALMKGGLEKLGFNSDELAFVQAVQTQYVGNLQQTLDLTYGAAIHSTVEMTLMLKKLKSHLADIDENPEAYVQTAFTKTGDQYIVKDAHAYRMEVVDRMVKVANLLRQMNTGVNEATKTRLVADKLRREMAQGEKGPKAVAGWATPAAKPTSV